MVFFGSPSSVVTATGMAVASSRGPAAPVALLSSSADFISSRMLEMESLVSLLEASWMTTLPTSGSSCTTVSLVGSMLRPCSCSVCVAGFICTCTVEGLAPGSTRPWMAMRSPGRIDRIRCQVNNAGLWIFLATKNAHSELVRAMKRAVQVSGNLKFTMYACLPSLGHGSGLLREGDKITSLTGGRDGESGGGEFDGLKRAGGDGVVGGGGGDDGRVVPRRHVRHRLDRLFLEFVLFGKALANS